MMRNELFMDEMRKLCEAIAPYGAPNGLALTLLRLCSPGIPDTYQGSEFWNQSLVDPDNRRPGGLRGAARGAVARSSSSARSDRAGARARSCWNTTPTAASSSTSPTSRSARAGARRTLFLHGDYESLAGGDHVVAFTRIGRSAAR